MSKSFFVYRYTALGGVFHGGIEVNGKEWSYGYCEKGTGVYYCMPKDNPMYSYRETVTLGATTLSTIEVRPQNNRPSAGAMLEPSVQPTSNAGGQNCSTAERELGGQKLRPSHKELQPLLPGVCRETWGQQRSG